MSPATTLTTLRGIIDALLKSDSVLTVDDKDVNLQRAVEEYSRRRPLRKTVEQTGDGTRIATLPSDWKERDSYILDIEYPLDKIPSHYIDKNYYAIKSIPAGLRLEFIGLYYPSDGDKYYIIYTVPHAVDASSSTIYGPDERAVATLAASYCCEALSSHYQQATDSTIAADGVARREKGDLFRSLATRYKDDFDEQVPNVAEEADGEWDPPTSVGTTNMFHNRR